MRVILGMIFGAALTVGAVFLYDNFNVGAGSPSSGSASATVEHRKMVNWDVVGDNWRNVSKRAREAWTTLSHKVSS
jgi:hypothetical protein